MKRNKMCTGIEKFHSLEEDKNKKSYSNPKLIDLGKMQRITLGTKGGSNLDSDALNPTPEFN